jgi:hypothetical protein
VDMFRLRFQEPFPKATTTRLTCYRYIVDDVRRRIVPKRSTFAGKVAGNARIFAELQEVNTRGDGASDTAKLDAAFTSERNCALLEAVHQGAQVIVPTLVVVYYGAHYESVTPSNWGRALVLERVTITPEEATRKSARVKKPRVYHGKVDCTGGENLHLQTQIRLFARTFKS